MAKWFNGLPRLVQFILLLIPFVGWVVEIIVRWSAFIENKKVLTLVAAIVFTIGGVILAYVDLVWVLLFKHLIFAKV